MGALDNLERCTFEGWHIPLVGIEIQASRRISDHYYRWISPSSAEDQGRTIYTFEISTTFQADPRYRPPLWPDTMNALRAHFNAGTVGTLVVPHIGRVICKIRSWSETGSGAMTSGFTAKLGFAEEEKNRFLPTIVQANSASFEAATDEFKALALEELPEPQDVPNEDFELVNDSRSMARDLFSQIGEAADAITAVRDQTELHGELAAGRIDFLIRKCREAIQSLTWLSDPMNHDSLYGLYGLWSAAVDLKGRPADEGFVRPKVFIVDRQMSVTEASQRIYGETTRSRDLLAINHFADAMRIPAGTRISYLP